VALWAFHLAADFREAVLKAVNLGDDADTTGAVCGQLAGAYWRVEGIPKQGLDGLAKREEVESAVRAITKPLPARCVETRWTPKGRDAAGQIARKQIKRS